MDSVYSYIIHMICSCTKQNIFNSYIKHNLTVWIFADGFLQSFEISRALVILTLFANYEYQRQAAKVVCILCSWSSSSNIRNSGSVAAAPLIPSIQLRW